MAARHPVSRLASQLLQSTKASRLTSASSISLASCRSRTHFPVPPRRIPPARYLSTTRRLQEDSKPTAPSQSQPSTSTHRKYTFPEILTITSSPSPKRILIDVREPSELAESGKIPTSLNLPLKTSPDFMFLSAEEFEDRFGRPRPGKDDEVIFYCRSGVRSKAAAELAKQAGFGGTVSEFPGSWLEWEKNGGTAERS